MGVGVVVMWCTLFSICASLLLLFKTNPLFFEQTGSKQLNIRNTRTLQMADDVLCVRISPDARYIAVALLDSTIKVLDGVPLSTFLQLLILLNESICKQKSMPFIIIGFFVLAFVQLLYLNSNLCLAS